MDGTCRPPELRDDASRAVSSAAETQDSARILSPNSIRLLTLTFVLCLIVFAAFAMREFRLLTVENGELKKENSVLRESRIALIDLFREQNHQAKDSAAASSADSTLSGVVLPQAGSRKSAEESRVRQYRPIHDCPYSITNGPVSERKVAITFDGGSSANVTDDILDTLASRSVIATIFLTGEFIRKNPDITRKIVAAGHICGNHTYSHPHMTTYSRNSIQSTLPEVSSSMVADELYRCSELFRSVTGSALAPLWRAPYGEFNNEICRWGYDAGYVHVGWRQGRRWLDGLDSNDWTPDSTVPGYKTPSEFLDKITKIASLPPPGINGGIILMHLGTERRVPSLQTHRLLGAVIDTLRAKGVEIVPVTELVAATGIDLASLRKRIDIQ